MRELRSIARRLDSSTALVCAALAAIALAGAGCVTPVEQYNQPGRITSVGPVEFDGSSVLINYTLLDPEGDDQSLQVGICPKDKEGSTDCPTPVTGAGGDGRQSLPTPPRGENVSHVLAWNVGCGRVADGNCPKTKLETSYVAYLSLEGSEKTVSSAPFSLADLGADEVPACDTTIRAIPDACQPQNGSSQ
ncbi:MAG: hypothetical protein ABEN55_16980 [Bradymonadaceae bacterium]